MVPTSYWWRLMKRLNIGSLFYMLFPFLKRIEAGLLHFTEMEGKYSFFLIYSFLSLHFSAGHWKTKLSAKQGGFCHFSPERPWWRSVQAQMCNSRSFFLPYENYSIVLFPDFPITRMRLSSAFLPADESHAKRSWDPGARHGFWQIHTLLGLRQDEICILGAIEL